MEKPHNALINSRCNYVPYMNVSDFCVKLCILLMLIGLYILAAPRIVCAAPLRVSVSQSPLSLPFYVAESQGYFAVEGVKVIISDVIGGHRTFQNMMDGTADLATSSEAVVMFNSFQRKDFAILATFVSSDDDVKMVVRQGKSILHPRQLAGKRVGTVVGAASHYFLETFLVLNGVDPKTVHEQNLQPEVMTEALNKGDVDAIAIWEPFPFKALAAVPDAKILPKMGVYRLTFNLIVHKKHIGTRDEELVKILRALERAELFISSQPAKAQAILRDKLKLDQHFIDWIWPRYTYRLTLDQALLMTMEGEARWARQRGFAKGERSPNYLDLVYSGPLSRVNPSAVSIIK